MVKSAQAAQDAGWSAMTPAAQQSVPFHRPDISDLEISRVTEVLRSGWLTTGAKALELESGFAAAVEAKFAIALSSCSAALHLALEAVGVGPGDEVIVPTMTFASTASAAVHLGAKPILADICADDHTVDPDAVARLCSPRTKAIVTVAFGGQAARMTQIMEFAHDRGIAVIEDAAHAFPASYRGRPVGSVADISCFSFYATKTLTTGEGGMATTDRADLAERMRLMSNHGITKNAHDRQQNGRNWHYDILDSGWKYNMPDMLATLGIAQLTRAQTILEGRRAIAARYQTAFAENDAIEIIHARPECEHSWHLFVTKIRSGTLTIDRDRFIEELAKRNVAASVHFIPLHMHPYFHDRWGTSDSDCPVAVDCYQRSLSLPIFSSMSDGQVDMVVDAVHDILRTFKR